MDGDRFDRSIQGLTRAEGRRDAVRSLGATGLALLAALGLAHASGKENENNGENGVQHGGRKRTSQVDGRTVDRHDVRDDARDLNRGNLVQAEGKRKKRKKRGPAGFTFATRVVISASSDPLPLAAGSIVNVTAECGGQGKVVSCGYQTGVVPAGLINVFVQAVEPDNARSFCFASLLRTAEAGSTAGATIQAVAVCLA